ncbi:MAG: DNA polymerase IV [Polaribacter sp.]|nr:DNA polymerase IV [Polaribacter sp.]
MKKNILHLDLDTFFVSCERLIDSRLKNKPLLVGGTGDRGIVAACSYETRLFGVHSGMSMKVAKRLCPEAVTIRGNTSIYSKYSQMVTEIVKEKVPLFEKASIDEFYADLTGMDTFFGSYKYASELRQRIIKESGLPISFGLSGNKIVSKVATGEAKPDNQLLINEGFEKEFMAPLSIRKIPSVGEKTYQILRNLGVEKVKVIQEMPVEMLVSVLGLNGRTIWKRANGIDNPPLIPFHERKSISTERTFNKDTIDMKKLSETIFAMAENLAYQLRKGDKLASVIVVKIRYSDFNTYTKQIKIPYTSADHIIIPAVVTLFKKLYQRRLLIRLVGVKITDIVSGNYQINLFDDSEQMINLYNAMDTIRNKYGELSITRAASMGAKTIGRYSNPFNGEPPTLLAHRKQ